jgi:hypothetical protein
MPDAKSNLFSLFSATLKSLYPDRSLLPWRIQPDRLPQQFQYFAEDI